ncbi:hypothetical protein BDW72DRAFT_166070 [Aspergillus terricola var. indicus]
MSPTSPAIILDTRSAPQNLTATSTSTSDSNANTDKDPVSDTLDPRTLATSAFTASLHSLGQNYTSALVDRAQNLHSNSQALKNQEAQLARHTESLRKQNDAWEKVADEGRNALKEIGDVQNWAEMIERDLLVVEDVVGILERELEEEEGRDDLDEDGDLRMEGPEGGDGRELEHGGTTVNGVANANVKMNGKVDRENGEEDGNDKKGKGKQAPSEKKGWFSWLW